MFDLILPAIASVVLVLIHSYFGIHVLKRQVIFVDLALAQIAALGGVYGAILGFSLEKDVLILKIFSFMFTIIGALGFSLSSKLDKKVPHEALIGIFYAVSLSLIFILSSNLPHGSDEIKQMFSGSILWVTKKDLFWSSILYLAVGVFHYSFREKFNNKKDLFWEFIFYVSLGLVVTSSVSIAGVLLVFGYLVIPASIGMILSNNIKIRLFFGMFFGVLASLIGIIISYQLNWPTGPAIIVVLSLFLLLAILKDKFFYFLIFISLILFLAIIPIKFNFKHHHEEKTVINLQDIPNILQQNIVLKKRDINALIDMAKNSQDEYILLDIAEILCNNNNYYGIEIFKKLKNSHDDFIREEVEKKSNLWR